MAQTKTSGLIVPEVWKATVQAKFLGKMVFRQFAVEDDTLEGNPGDTVNLSKFNKLTDISGTLTEGTAMVPEALTSATDGTLTVAEIGKAVEITDDSILYALGDTVGEANTQIATVIARKQDADLRDKAYTAGAGQTVTKAAVISYNNVIDALAPYGDEVTEGGFSLIIHSKQFRDIVKDSAFQNLANFGEGASSVPGPMGMLGTIPVYVSDRITVVSGTPDTYKSLVIRNQPLAYVRKREALVETDRDILARSTIIATSVHYGTALLNATDVVILVTQ